MDGFCYIQTNFKKTDAEGIYGYYNFIEWLDSSCYNVNIQKTGHAVVKVTARSVTQASRLRLEGRRNK